LLLSCERFFHAVRNGGACRAQTNLGHRGLELLAIFRLVDRFRLGADQLDLVLVEHAVVPQIERAIERSLATHGRQDRVRTLFLDDFLDHLPGDRLDIGHVRHVRIGHDRRRIRVDQDDLVTFFTQRLAGLRAGIVKFAGLADHNRASANNQDGFNVCTFGHCVVRCQG